MPKPPDSEERAAIACGAVSERELAQIDAAAAAKGLSRSAFVRGACLFAAGLIDRPAARRKARALAHQDEPTEGKG